MNCLTSVRKKSYLEMLQLLTCKNVEQVNITASMYEWLNLK